MIDKERTFYMTYHILLAKAFSVRIRTMFQCFYEHTTELIKENI